MFTPGNQGDTRKYWREFYLLFFILIILKFSGFGWYRCAEKIKFFYFVVHDRVKIVGTIVLNEKAER